MCHCMGSVEKILNSYRNCGTDFMYFLICISQSHSSFRSLKEEEGRGGRAGEDTTAVSHREVTVARFDVGLTVIYWLCFFFFFAMLNYYSSRFIYLYFFSKKINME